MREPGCSQHAGCIEQEQRIVEEEGGREKETATESTLFQSLFFFSRELHVSVFGLQRPAECPALNGCSINIFWGKEKVQRKLESRYWEAGREEIVGSITWEGEVRAWREGLSHRPMGMR